MDNSFPIGNPRFAIRNSRKLDVFARIHLEIQRQGILGVRLDDFFRELYEDRVFAKNGVLVHRLKIDGDEERPGQFRVNSFPAFDAENLRNFQELHPGVHHHRLYPGGGDLGLKFVEDDMMNHEGKAIRRFQRAAQVRIRNSEANLSTDPEIFRELARHCDRRP